VSGSPRADEGRAAGSEIQVRREDIASSAATTLILALNAELTREYEDPSANHFRLDADEVAEGRGAFFVAYQGGRPVGCGAIRRLDPDTVEVKRMYVDPTLRSLGIGRKVLDALEIEARALGAKRVILETGTRQHAAIALYSRAGFSRIPAFGEYLGSAWSVCMGKDL
jgi:GNAT superfamily N-acetyltransferase